MRRRSTLCELGGPTRSRTDQTVVRGEQSPFNATESGKPGPQRRVQHGRRDVRPAE